MAKEFTGIRLDPYTQSNINGPEFQHDLLEHGVRVKGGDFPKYEIEKLIAWLRSIEEEK